MNWNSRTIRTKTAGKSLKSSKRRTPILSSPPCPTITLGDLSTNVGQVGLFYESNIDITGGLGPYNLSVISGILPPGTSLMFFHGVWQINGGAITFGKYTFTIGGTDSNGCAVTPKEYVIEIWVRKSVTPGIVNANDSHDFTVLVSEIAGIYGITATLAKIAFDIICPDLNGSIGCFIYSPNTTPPSSLFTSGWDSQGMDMSGNNLTRCVINNNSLGSFPNTSTGMSPYTGNWNNLTDGESRNYYDFFFTGDTMIGIWTAHIDTGSDPSEVSSIDFYFKPI